MKNFISVRLYLLYMANIHDELQEKQEKKNRESRCNIVSKRVRKDRAEKKLRYNNWLNTFVI